jgi:predicted ATP-dependent serine protease
MSKDLGSPAAWNEKAGRVFLATSHRAPLAALLHGLEADESLIVITGEPGVGKTTLLESAILAGESNGRCRIWCGTEAADQITLVSRL